jgi:hypothetical protein
MRVRPRSTFTAFALGLAVAALGTPGAAAVRDGAGDPLGTIITRAIHDGGPFFTPAEQAVINRKCGYAPGEWDGYDVSIENGVFRCKNGRTVDDAEMRALLDVARPRISARVSAAMDRPEVKAAIREVARESVRKALANLRTPADD